MNLKCRGQWCEAHSHGCSTTLLQNSIHLPKLRVLFSRSSHCWPALVLETTSLLSLYFCLCICLLWYLMEVDSDMDLSTLMASQELEQVCKTLGIAVVLERFLLALM